MMAELARATTIPAVTRPPSPNGLREDATQNGGWASIETTPTFAEAMLLTEEPFGFLFCGIAVSPSSTLYLQTGHELWVGTPIG